MMTKAKVSGNYVGSILAKTESQRAGFDEAIMLDPQGYVAECTGENIFLVRNNTIYTPARGAILEGITRDSLLALASDLGHTIVEEPISRDQLYIADEVFVSGTAAEVVGLREIDFRTIGNGKTGPVTRALQAEFEKLTSGRHPRSAGGCLLCRHSMPHWPESNQITVRARRSRYEKTQTPSRNRSCPRRHRPSPKNGPLATPIYQTSTFEVTDSEQQVRATSTDMFYTRYGNPTHTVAEKALQIWKARMPRCSSLPAWEPSPHQCWPC